MSFTVVVPTFNEAENVVELVQRLSAACGPDTFDLLFMDDGSDDLPGVACRVGLQTICRLVVHRRTAPSGGLSGAVVEGLNLCETPLAVVIDGDLQHPPEMVPAMIAALADADIVVASRYMKGGASSGLDRPWRHVVSGVCTGLARILFPVRLRHCTDPMAGAFAVRLDRLDAEVLRPRGYKVLLEILVTHRLAIAEIPYSFALRSRGESKASARQGLAFVVQLLALRFRPLISRRHASEAMVRPIWDEDPPLSSSHAS